MASANAMSAECCEGVVHIGAPNGTEIKVGDLDVYHHSSGQSSPSGCILFLTDIHGWQLLNNRLLCDVYARAGFEVYMPDLFQGDPMQRAPAAPSAGQSDAEAAALAAAQRMKQMEAWRARHGDDVVVPLIRQMVSDLRTMHPTLKLGSIGFCWGGRYSILSAGGDQPLVDAFCAAHPSRVQVPTDIEAIQRTPGLWCLASTDKMFTPETIEATKAVMATKPQIPAEFIVYPNTNHGFAVRGDDTTQAQREQCQTDVVNFFRRTLSSA